MSQIEEIMYLAKRSGITQEVFEQVKLLKAKDKHKYTSLSDIYELALTNVNKTTTTKHE